MTERDPTPSDIEAAARELHETGSRIVADMLANGTPFIYGDAINGRALIEIRTKDQVKANNDLCGARTVIAEKDARIAELEGREPTSWRITRRDGSVYPTVQRGMRDSALRLGLKIEPIFPDTYQSLLDAKDARIAALEAQLAEARAGWSDWDRALTPTAAVTAQHRLGAALAATEGTR